MKSELASPTRSTRVKPLVCAGLLALALPSAQAALLFDGIFNPEPNNDATPGLIYGSTDSIVGLGNLSINGTSNNFFLEALNPGLGWSNFKLTVYDVTTETGPQPDAPTGSLAAASINGIAATSSTFAATGPNPLGLSGLPGLSDFFNVYTFSFANLVLGGGTNNIVTLAGFNSARSALNLFSGLDGGGAVLTTTAIPEPSTYALLFAGLAAVGWVARRRAPGRA